MYLLTKRVSIGSTVNRKTAKKFNRKNWYGGNNGKVLTVKRKLVKILTVSRKSHHPTETLYQKCINIFQ